MPKRIERHLESEARAKGLTGRRRAAYVYGTLARIKKRQAPRKRHPAKSKVTRRAPAKSAWRFL